ncbi:MAG: ISAs1 family transposase [Chloroflexi bacterium]|nr:ISAs1 family transposase [Chloroflexota bacterium]
MTQPIAGRITEHFAQLKDPRIERTKRHQLLDIIVIAICAVICGADSWPEIEAFGKAKQPWLKQFLALPHGIPSHDTFWRVFARLDPQQFQQSFISWVQAISDLTQGQVIAIDGKTLRRSHDREQGQAAIHMVSAWATANRLVLGQLKVDQKSNEITAVPTLLRLLAIEGCIVRLDALGCQSEIAQTIVDQHADYVLAVKENQEQLYHDLKDLFEDAYAVGFREVPHDYHRSVSKGHGRLEIRQCWTLSDPDYLGYLRQAAKWPHLHSLAMVRAERRTATETTCESRYFITSLEGRAEQVLHAVRAHWSIENELHWVLDIAFREDESRLRKDHGPENFALLRHIALNLLKQDKSVALGLKGKRLKAAWDERYLLTLLSL